MSPTPEDEGNWGQHNQKKKGGHSREGRKKGSSPGGLFSKARNVGKLNCLTRHGDNGQNRKRKELIEGASGREENPRTR